MEAKLTPNICYMAGLFSKGPKSQKNFVSINSSIQELRDRFVEIAVNNLGVMPNKIIFGSNSDVKSVGFFHSRVAKRLIDIAKREVYVFKADNELSRSYIAGMFDASGHFGPRAIEIRHINANDAIMLQNLGIHSRGDKILNISRLMELIMGRSLVLSKFNVG